MQIQNNTLRAHALGNFKDMSRAMVQDWCAHLLAHGEENVAYSPNENLGREFMELFTLGVGNYTQTDVHQAALGFTGYHVNFNAGAVTVRRQAARKQAGQRPRQTSGLRRRCR